jgi:serine/threonine protein phosphatase PrpC
MSVRLLAASRTDVGRVRPSNEDAFLVADDAHLVAVADGMGGHQAGEVASATAITALLDGVHRGATIGDAISGANDAVLARAAEDPSLRGMGTTMTAAVLHGATLVIGHVGDSRAYLLRDGVLVQLTTDHSVIAELVAAGELTEAEAEIDPRRAMITRALGIDPSVEVDVFDVGLVPGDRLLLCSDGLTTMVRDEVIARILVEEHDRERAADTLVAAANDAGGADNITVVVVDVVEVPDADPIANLPAAPAPAAPPEPVEHDAAEGGAAEGDPADTGTAAIDPPEDDPAATASAKPRRRPFWRRRPS